MNHHACTEDVRWMIAGGECLTGAARRLGISADGLEKWLQIHGLRAELLALRGREPISVENTPRRLDERATGRSERGRRVGPDAHAPVMAQEAM